MRAATTAAFHEPAETPTVMAGRIPSASSRSTAPTWNAQRALPPEKMKATFFA